VSPQQVIERSGRGLSGIRVEEMRQAAAAQTGCQPGAAMGCYLMRHAGEQDKRIYESCPVLVMRFDQVGKDGARVEPIGIEGCRSVTHPHRVHWSRKHLCLANTLGFNPCPGRAYCKTDACATDMLLQSVVLRHSVSGDSVSPRRARGRAFDLILATIASRAHRTWPSRGGMISFRHKAVEVPCDRRRPCVKARESAV